FYRVYLWRALGVAMLVGLTTHVARAIGRSLLPVAADQAFEQLLSLLASLTVFAFLRAAGTNLVWSSVVLCRHASPVYFLSTLSVPSMIWIYLSNAIAIGCSLGLLIPWARVRTMRYRLSHLSVSFSGTLETFVASEPTTVGAVGEAVMDFFEVDIGL